MNTISTSTQYLIFAIVFSYSCKMFGQCPSDSFYTQQEIDDFPLYHPGCTHLDGDLYIHGNSITNLDGLSQINSVAGNVYITGSINLLDLNGLNNLQTIGGILNFFYTEFPEISGFNSLVSVQHIFFETDKCQQVSGFNSLENVNDIQFLSCYKLISINGFNLLEDCDKFEISTSSDLESILGFDQLTSIGSFEFNDNPLITNISAFRNLNSVGGLYISGNSALEDLSFCNKLTHITEGWLLIQYNQQLMSLKGLESLVHIEEVLWVEANSNVKSLDGLQALQTIGGAATGLHIAITNNNSLVSLAGISNIDPNSITTASTSDLEIHITNNVNLSVCHVASICGAISLPTTGTIIQNNSFGCNSQTQIETECLTPKFRTFWSISTSGDSITIPTVGAGYNYSVAWGDGQSTSGHTGDASHIYTAAGTYLVSISGDFQRIGFFNSGDKLKIQEVVEWGAIQWTSFEGAFWGCSNLTGQAIDEPDLSQCTNMSVAFRDASAWNQKMNDWNVSTITNMSEMFSGTSDFNQDISSWSVENVSNMTGMFNDITISTENYDAILIGWEAQNLMSGLVFSGGNSTYCAGESARENMILNDLWTIIDEGKDPYGSCCPNILPVNGNPVLDGTYKAEQSITCEGIIPMNGDVSLKAGIDITLLPNLEIQSGAVLRVEISGCE